ncbi:MAG TPA: YicC/YloC family endoribonuclease [Methylibium sp.]|uniref:YicC/YloC family endoribonuclease n=1 Tax=Methylibium sp. TaxID=2067992 RepID=UPI002DB88B23|nr:YicC/YloC family endoribonuclease [Methylibium sp.]HEU4458546.1 YicC/YloC family endoribonuclease [Methylibium sp.]
MSVYSMTGYGSCACGPREDVQNAHKDGLVDGGEVLVELRSVNSRFLDIAWRLPDELRGLEAPLRELLAGRLRRGKLEVRIAARKPQVHGPRTLDAARLSELAALEAQVLAHLPQAARLGVAEAIDRCRPTEDAAFADALVLDAARRALAALVDAREREGAKLVQVLRERLGALRHLAAQAAPLVPQAVQRQQARFLERWNEALAATNVSGASAEAARERALQEAAAHALRIDVAEELARLGAHLDEIDRLLTKGGEVGKRLDFLIQELQREANTLGSKAAAIELTRISVEMKVAIEQMREQVQNIE